MAKTFIEHSEDRSWHRPDSKGASIEEINCGSFMRIANAAEMMASSYETLRQQKESAERACKHWREETARLQRSISALRGAITKLKSSAKR